MRSIVVVGMLVLGAMPAVAATPTTTVASWYGARWTGRLTASGERFDHRQLTAASRHHPMGTMLLVTHGDRHVVVRVNDRGPFARNRGLDLSEAAARELGVRDQGVVRVAYQVMR